MKCKVSVRVDSFVKEGETVEFETLELADLVTGEVHELKVDQVRLSPGLQVEGSFLIRRQGAQFVLVRASVPRDGGGS